MAKSFQGPRGTRDLYPEDVLRRRYITRAWRDASVRFGFEEIEGPTFEPLELYTVKSGEGIVSELFSFRREGGDDDYALRPEFTPTLARMYAARARQLPKPTKWFTAGAYFRAEKPQRGRLREFLQWNVDYIGLVDEGDDNRFPSAVAHADWEIAHCCIHLLQSLGLSQGDVVVRAGSRPIVSSVLRAIGVRSHEMEPALQLLDARPKMTTLQFEERANALSFSTTDLDPLLNAATTFALESDKWDTPGYQVFLKRLGGKFDIDQYLGLVAAAFSSPDYQWLGIDLTIARGLSYYTGTVFEVIAEGERAVAGGGRYDGLIELCGGPSTPAVGFAMGDVVLGLLLDDKGLMPEGAALREAVARAGASVRPEAFVVPTGDVGDDDVRRVVARLRRGAALDETLGDGSVPGERKAWQRPAGLHARHSYKSTRNPKKLIGDASNQFARFAVILESPDEATIRDLDARDQDDTRYAVAGGVAEKGSLLGALYRRLGRGAEVGLSG